MKAIYQKPAIGTMATDMSELLAASLFTNNGDGSMSQDLGDAPTTTEESGNLSRHSLWEDDEYDY
jgi:hypothetical protein